MTLEIVWHYPKKISKSDISFQITVPDRIRDVLISRYEYVVAEKEVIPDLTDSIRLCGTCQDWCSR